MSRKACILILDDDPTMLATLEMKVKRLLTPGDVVFTAKSGEDAIKILTQREESGQAIHNEDSSDLFLVDLNMPGRTKGFDVIIWIRERPIYNDCPIVVLTSSDAETDRERAYMLGANDFRTKPKRLIEVMPILKSILDKFREGAYSTMHDSMGARVARANES